MENATVMMMNLRLVSGIGQVGLAEGWHPSKCTLGPVVYVVKAPNVTPVDR